MLTLDSILRHICQFFKGLAVKVTKQMYRSSAVFMAGAAVITVVAFTSAGFGSGGRNALTAFAETRGQDTADEEDAEEDEAVTEAKIQSGRQLAGSLLQQEIQQKQELKRESKAEIERIHAEAVMAAEAKAREEEAEALKARQEAERLAKLEEEKAARAVSVSDDDYQVLLKIVQAEAGICDAKGKILVANVVLNRVKSREFPNTVRGVVYEPSQFSPVSNGSINSVSVSKETRACVDRALSGEDYSDGALYFMYRQGSRSRAVSWFDSHLTYLFRHGNHEFFK